MRGHGQIRKWMVGFLYASAIVSTVVAQDAPYSFTRSASLITASSAVLNGSASPNGNPSQAWFEWGTNNTFSQQTPLTDVGNGNGVVNVNAAITGLAAGGIYSCRLMVSNANGTVQGWQRQFTTGQSVSLWPGSATNWPVDLTNAVAIAGYGSHFLSIRTDGSIAAWGSNTYGESSVPANATNAAAVSCGSRYSLALLATGKVLGWGDNGLNQISVPTDLSNVVDIAAGYYHTLALKADGTVVAWGANSFGEATVPTDLSNVVAVACGTWHSLALRNDGTLVGWGDGGNGQLTFPDALTNVVAISAGDHMNALLQPDGTVWALGAVGAGGGSTWISYSGTLCGPGNIIAIAADGDSAIGMDRSGTLTNWGNAPVTPPSLSNVANISSGWLALAPNVPPQVASQTNYGFPNNDLIISLTANDVNGDPLALRITSLPATGTLYQFNNSARGDAITHVDTVVSDSAGRVIFAPVPDGFGSPYASFDYVANDGKLDSASAEITVDMSGAPYAFSRAARRVHATDASLSGTVTANGLSTSAWWEWGLTSDYGQATSATNVGSGTGVVQISTAVSNLISGAIYHCRLVASNATGVVHGAERLFTTGRNVTQFQSSLVPGLSNIVAIAGGGGHSLALRNDGTVVAWGANGSGQTNVPAGLSNIVAIAGGGAHSLALRDDGQTFGWGDHSQNALAVLPSGICDIAAGAYHSLYLKNDGTVLGYGAYSHNLGQVTPPAGLSNVVAISAGTYHSLALKNDGTVVAWGSDNYGQCDVPSGLSNVVAIAAGSYHSLALQKDGTMVTWGWMYDSIHGYYATMPLPSGLSNVVEIAAGYGFNLGMGSDGRIAGGATVAGYLLGITVPGNMTPGVHLAANNSDGLAIADLNPAANAIAVSGPANRDVTMTFSGSDPNLDLLTFDVTTLPLGGTLYQYNSGNRGDAIVAPNTALSDPQNRLIFAPDTNSYGVSSFSIVANDGWTNSAPATVTVTITASAGAVTGPCTFLNSSNVMIYGWGTGGGLPATAWFEWGTNSAFGQATAQQSLDTSLTDAPLSAALNNLLPDAEYHYRLVVSNAAMVVYGAEKIFTTGKPVLAWGVNDAGQVNVPAPMPNALAVAGGANFSLALLADRTVTGWGQNDAGQASPPDGLTNVTAIAAGLAHSLALLADGTVVAWGTNNYFQTNVPDGLSGVLAIAAGGNHNLALKADGTVASWGLNTSGQTNVPPNLSNAVDVAAGWSHSAALRADGTVICWGANNYGQNNSGGLSTVVAIAAGGNHTLALKTNGTVAAFGSNTYGESSVPPTLTNVIAIAAGTNQSYALRRDGTIVCWGRNDQGQCSVPLNIGATLAIAAGDSHVLVLSGTSPVPFAITEPAGPVRLTNALLRGMATANDAGATAWFEWGTNSTFSQSTPPMPVTDGGNVCLISDLLTGLKPYTAYCSRLLVSNSVCVVTGRTAFFATGGQVRSWGTAAGGQTNVTAALAGTVALSAGTGHALAVLADGTVAAWGTNNYKQLNVPANATNIISVAAGGYHSLALNENGRVIAWGRSLEGQTNVPATLSNVLAIAAGDRHSLALRNDGAVVAWGYNGSGQTSVPAWLTNVVAIAAAGNTSVALKQDGVAVVWGNPAALPANANNLTAIAAATNNVLLLKGDGHVVAWGNNLYGQTNVPASVSNAVDVAMGERHGNVLKADRTVQGWMGYEPSNQGETNVPPGLTNVVSLVSAGTYNLALVAGTIPPRVFATAPGPITPGSAVLNGVLVPNDLAATAWFEWGTNGLFTQATTPFLVSSSSSIIFTNAMLSGLAPGGIYSCRLAASNSAGISRSMEQRFTTGRKILAWGRNNYGQTNIPPGLTNVVAVAGGQYYSAALLNDGTVRVWGYNGNNQTNVPTSATNVIAIASGLNHLLALRSNHTVVTWGLNTSGLASVPTTATNVVAIACGENHSLALRGDGKIIAWGDNSRGQTTVPANLGDVVGIAGGGGHTLALMADGSVRAWGYNSSGQTNVPAAASNIVAVAAGDSFSLALRADTTAVGWGSPTPTSNNTNLIAIAGLYFHMLALKTNGTLVGWGNNTYGQSSTSATGIASLAAGGYHSLVVGPNAPPSVDPQTVIGAANRDIFITPTASDPNGDPLSFRIATLPAAGTLYQNAGGGRGAAIVSPNTPVTDTQGKIIFSPAPDEAGWPYTTFNLTANDGEADSPPGLTTINILTRPVISLDNPGAWTDGTFTLNFTSDSNATFRVWTSTNLLDWSVLGNAYQTTPGVFQFMDPAATNAAWQFYRVTCP